MSKTPTGVVVYDDEGKFLGIRCYSLEEAYGQMVMDMLIEHALDGEGEV
jgi:hypothetical protein